ncbi:RDD family protein [Porticoccus sp. GXU_MW_L64]
MEEKENVYQTPEADLIDSGNSASDERELASRWLRLGANILDSLIVGIPFFVLMYVTGFWSSMLDNPENYTTQIGLFLAGTAMWLAFNGALLKNHGQTIGKRVVDIQIVEMDSDKVPTLMNTAGIRYILIQVIAWIPLIGSLFALVDILFIFRKDKRCIHDLMAKTKVVKYQPPCT